MVTKWFPDKGFGFVAVDGRRAFVHVSDIEPYQERGTDLSGKTLVVYSTEESEKGFRVNKAVTPEEHEKTLARLAEQARQEEEERLAKERKVQEAEAYINSRGAELLEELRRLFAEGKVQKDDWGRLRGLTLADSSLRAKLIPTQAKVLSEQPLRLEAELFAEVSRVEGRYDSVIAKMTVGPIAHFIIEGWEMLEIGPHERNPARFCPSRWEKPESITWAREKLVATIEFAAKNIPAPVFFSREFPITPEAPYRDKERVMQRIVCATPCGEVSHLLRLSPKEQCSDYPTYMQIWGGYDITALIAEASLFASEQEVSACLAEKFKQEGIPSTWEESGDNYISHEDSGVGMHGGDYVSVTYTNQQFSDDIDRLYGLDLRKVILSEVALIPAEAVALGWSFRVENEWGVSSWPKVRVPMVVAYDRTDNDLQGYDIPRWVSPVQRAEYRKVLDAVLSGMTAKEAVKSFLGECAKANPLERQAIAKWLRYCRKEGIRHYREWRNPPAVKNPKLAEFVSKIFVELKEKQLCIDGLKAEEARKAAEHAEQEKRIVDLAKVRKDWREMLKLRRRSTSDLHEDAQALLEKIRTAQDKANYIAFPRKEAIRYEQEQRRAREEAQRQKTEKDKFLNKTTWGALDSLNLKEGGKHE